MGEKIISKNSLAALIVFIFLATAIVQATGLAQKYDFIDQVLHFLGGAWVAIFFFVFFQARLHLFDLNRNWRLTAFFALATVALIGVGWEIFQYLVGILTKDNWIGTAAWGMDTFSDLIWDIIGAALVSFIFTIKRTSRFERRSTSF